MEKIKNNKWTICLIIVYVIIAQIAFYKVAFDIKLSKYDQYADGFGINYYSNSGGYSLNAITEKNGSFSDKWEYIKSPCTIAVLLNCLSGTICSIFIVLFVKKKENINTFKVIIIITAMILIPIMIDIVRFINLRLHIKTWF